MFTSKPIELFYLFFQGVLIFQALVFVVIYFIAQKKDILYYSLFLFMAAAYFFVNAPYTFFNIPEEKVWESAWYDYVNTPVIIIENFFYLLFLQAFFADISSNKIANRVFRFTLWLMPVLMLLFILLTSLKLDKQFIFYTVKLICIIPAMMVAVVIIRHKLPFARLVANGLLCTIIGTCITVLMILLGNNGIHSLFTTGYPLFFIRLGLLGDMIFYLAAILKKWHHQEKELALEKIHSQLEVEKIRNKISGELHDDIGSALSGIAMYSHIAEGQLQSNNYDKAKNSLTVIQSSAKEIVGKLSDLVWAIKPGKDSLAAMLERVERYGEEMCRAKDIRFEYSLGNIDLIKEPGLDVRQHLYLFSKEAINNAVKYSGATVIQFEASVTNGTLRMSVKDNGSGFDAEKISKGNGLANMEKRAAEIGGEYLFQSRQNIGTHAALSLKIPQ